VRLAIVVPLAILLIATMAKPEDARPVVARARQQIESANYRATGKFVTVDAGGKRTNYALAIKARWFPGVLRALVEIAPPSETATRSHQDARVRILFEMRPNGQNTIRVAHANGSGLVSLPFEKWGDGLFGGNFSYEDFLESQYYWENQTILKRARFGARDCDVLRSTPGASDRTHYAQVQTWLDHTIAYPVYAEKTVKGGGVVKEFTYLGLRQTGGVWSASQVEARIQGRSGSTLLIVERGSAKASLTEKDFSTEQIHRFEDRP
jgi:hypothetical protein